jgi:hypothetical protein
MLPATLNWEARLTGDDPDEQVRTTIEMMSRYVREDCQSPAVLQAAQIAAPPGTDPIEGIFEYVKGLIRFQADERTAEPLSSHLDKAGLSGYPVVEVLIRPRDMLTWQGDTGRSQVGDCDDFSMLTAALLKARGMDASFVTVAADPRLPGQFSHVYVAAYTKDGRVALDTSHGQYAGWEVTENMSRKEEWPIESNWRGIVLAGLLALIAFAHWSKSWKWRTA